MDDLITWLRAQLDDDERVAREITAPEWSEGSSWLADLRDPLPSQRRAYGLSKEWQLLSEADTRHIARWDPARVLAEIDAKRRIIDECDTILRTSSPYFTVESCDEDDAILAGHIVRLLALPYADREGYRPEWRPVP